MNTHNNVEDLKMNINSERSHAEKLLTTLNDVLDKLDLLEVFITEFNQDITLRSYLVKAIYTNNKTGNFNTIDYYKDALRYMSEDICKFDINESSHENDKHIYFEKIIKEQLDTCDIFKEFYKEAEFNMVNYTTEYDTAQIYSLALSNIISELIEFRKEVENNNNIISEIDKLREENDKLKKENESLIHKIDSIICPPGVQYYLSHINK